VRLFVAIEIPGEIRNTLAEFLKELRAVAPQAKWVRPENMHVTLKFLGETGPAKVGPIVKVLDGVRNGQPVTLEFRGLGYFPNEKRPRVFWAGMEASANLKTLAGEADQGLHRLGFALEDRAFTPHLTLARFDPPGLPAKLGPTAAANWSRSFGSFTVREFHLIESKLKPAGAEYTTVQTFSFVTES